MSRFAAFLRQPYPVPDDLPAQVRRALLTGLFVGGFLLLFQPFGLSQWVTPHKVLKIAGFGVVSLLATVGYHLFWATGWPHAFREARWTVGRAVLFVNGNVLLVAAGNFLYLYWLLGIAGTPYRLVWVVAITFLVGLFPTSASITATYIRQLRRYQQGAAALGSAPAVAEAATPTIQAAALLLTPPEAAATPAPRAAGATGSPPPEVVNLIPDNGRDALAVPAAHLLYLEAADNYCTVVYGPPGTAPARALLRASLSGLAAQLTTQAAPAGAGQLVRVHRSYYANLSRVSRVSGNAQGYRLHFADLPTAEATVPVARAYNDVVTAAFR